MTMFGTLFGGCYCADVCLDLKTVLYKGRHWDSVRGKNWLFTAPGLVKESLYCSIVKERAVKENGYSNLFSLFPYLYYVHLEAFTSFYIQQLLYYVGGCKKNLSSPIDIVDIFVCARMCVLLPWVSVSVSMTSNTI